MVDMGSCLSSYISSFVAPTMDVASHGPPVFQDHSDSWGERERGREGEGERGR